MPRLTANQSAWILILSVAVALRVAGGIWWQSRLGAEQKFFFGDSHAYSVLGQAVARGDPYQYESPDRRVFRSPGYPLLLAGLFRILGDDAKPMAARVLNAALGGVAVGLVGWWATWLFDAQAGRIAGWIAALYPGTVAMGAFVLSEAGFCVVMLLQLALWGLAWRATSNSRTVVLALAAGAAGATATLIRPSWLLFAPFALAVALVIDRRRARHVIIGVTMGVSFVACLLPWWIRNAQVSGRFVATTLQTGASLYDGLNPDADGSSNMEFVPKFTAEERAVDSPGPDTFEYRLDRRMREAALAWARENPLRAVQLAGIKLLRTWNVWPNEPSLRSWPLRLAVFVTYTPLVCLSLVGIWRFTSWGWPYTLAWLPAVYLSVLHVVFVGSIRYREPAMLALTVLAAGVLAGFSRERSPLDGATNTPIPSPVQPS